MSAAPLPGFVYFDKNFRFSDGCIGEKLFVVLCDSTLDEDYVLVARTTSKAKSELEEACFNTTPHPSYCLPVHCSKFEKDTWVMLDEVHEYSKEHFDRWDRTTDVSVEQIIDILLCAAGSRFTPKWVSQALIAEAGRLSSSL